MPFSIHVCPGCQSKLTLMGSILKCKTCPHEYKIVNNIPVFLSKKPVEDRQTADDLIRLNHIAKTKGWHHALEEIYGTGSEIVKYVTSSGRANFLDLLTLKKENRVLEIGPGLGQFTPLIAEKVKHVYALEVVQGQAEFSSERCRQQGVTNVQFACGGDDCRLPYPDGSMDNVIMNLVFEWCATRNSNEAADVGQLRILDEILRVLNPHGSLYLSTKNRFAMQYLLGNTDEHSFHMRFGNALPRSLHNFLLKRNGYDRPQGLLHSHNKLQSMMSKAGFSDLQSYWATPEMRFPEYYIPTDAASVRLARSKYNFSQGDMRRVKLLMPLVPAAMVKHVTPGLTFIALKPSKIF